MTRDPRPETWDLGRRLGTWDLEPLFFFMPLLPPIFCMHLYPPIFSTLEKNDLQYETFALHVIALYGNIDILLRGSGKETKI